MLNIRLVRGGSFLLLITLFAISSSFILNRNNAYASVPYSNTRVNLTSSGGQTTGLSSSAISVSQDGRYIAFMSADGNIVTGDTNGLPDIFVRDRVLGTTVRASVSNSGAQLTSGSLGMGSLSGNGRFLTFTAYDTALGNTYNNFDVFVRDLKNNTTELISKNPAGTASGNGNSGGISISADGRYAVFASTASNLVSGDTNGVQDVFVRDRLLGITTLLSKSDSGTIGNDYSYTPTISCDGNYIAFNSDATNLVSGDTNAQRDVFLVKRAGGDSIKALTLSADATNFGIPKLSCDGSSLIFSSSATNLVSGDTNGLPDAFLYSIYDNTFERLNVSSAGAQTTTKTVGSYDLSFNGRYVTFSTQDPGLVSGDTNGFEDVFVRDRQTGVTEILSKRDATTQTNQLSTAATMTQDGKYVLYDSRDASLVSGDTNGTDDAFIAPTGY